MALCDLRMSKARAALDPKNRLTLLVWLITIDSTPSKAPHLFFQVSATAELTAMPQRIVNVRLTLSVGGVENLASVVERLERLGYERRPTVLDVAQFAVRGGPRHRRQVPADRERRGVPGLVARRENRVSIQSSREPRRLDEGGHGH